MKASDQRKGTRAPIKKPEFREISAAGLSGFTSLFSDSSMEATPANVREWRMQHRDYQVSSTWQQRQLALMKLDWSVKPGADDAASQSAADYLSEQLDRVGFDRVSQKMHFGLYYGFAIAEMMYIRDGRYIGLDDIKVRAAERFRFDRRTGAPLFVGGGNPQGDPLAANKFWLFTAPGDSDDTPHGPPLGWRLYWPLFLKRNGARFWAVALEKYGMPTAAGTFPDGADQDAQDNFLQTLLAIHGSGAVSFPEGFKAELLEATRAAGGDYERFEAYWDKAVSKIILSQTMTTDDGSSKSQADVHLSVRDDVVQADADLLCATFSQGPGRWLTAWNFPGATPPIVSRTKPEVKDLDKQAERDRKIAEATGRRPTADYVKDTYGMDMEDRPTGAAARPGGGAAPAFADFDPEDADTPGALVDQLEELAGAEDDALIDGMRALLDGAGSIEEAQRRLLDYASSTDGGKLADLIGGAFAVADLAGRADVE